MTTLNIRIEIIEIALSSKIDPLNKLIFLFSNCYLFVKIE